VMRAKGDCDAQDEVSQEESEQNEVDGMKKGADSTGEMMHFRLRFKSCFLIQFVRSRHVFKQEAKLSLG